MAQTLSIVQLGTTTMEQPQQLTMFVSTPLQDSILAQRLKLQEQTARMELGLWKATFLLLVTPVLRDITARLE
jgi:hypothetical protein